MRAFHTHISEISTYIEYGDDITDPYIINQIFGINHPQQGARITPTSAPSNESVGECRRRNGEIDENSNVWKFNLKINFFH